MREALLVDLLVVSLQTASGLVLLAAMGALVAVLIWVGVVLQYKECRLWSVSHVSVYM